MGNMGLIELGLGMMGSRMSKPCRSPNIERAGTILNQPVADRRHSTWLVRGTAASAMIDGWARERV